MGRGSGESFPNEMSNRLGNAQGVDRGQGAVNGQQKAGEHFPGFGPKNQISYTLILRRRRPARPRTPEPSISNVLGSGTGLEPKKVWGTPSVQPVWLEVGTYTRTLEYGPGVKPAMRAASGSGDGCPSLRNQASALIAEFAPPSARARVYR